MSPWWRMRINCTQSANAAQEPSDPNEVMLTTGSSVCCAEELNSATWSKERGLIINSFYWECSHQHIKCRRKVYSELQGFSHKRYTVAFIHWDHELKCVQIWFSLFHVKWCHNEVCEWVKPRVGGVCVFVTEHIFTHMDICGSERQISGCTHQMIQHFMDEINVLWV